MPHVDEENENCGGQVTSLRNQIWHPGFLTSTVELFLLHHTALLGLSTDVWNLFILTVYNNA